MGRYFNNKELFLSCICFVVDDLIIGKVCVFVKYFLWLGVICNRKLMFSILYYFIIFLTRRSRVFNVWSFNDIIFYVLVINICVSDKSYSVYRNLFLEYNIFRYCVRFYFVFYFDVENLKSFISCEIELKIS